MFFWLLFANARQLVGALVPAFAAQPVIISLSAGSCSGNTPASIRLFWSVSNFDPALHIMEVFQKFAGGSRVLVVAQNTTTYDKTIGGLVEGGPFSPQSTTFRYEIDIVRLADGALLARSDEATRTTIYGRCHAVGTPEPT